MIRSCPLLTRWEEVAALPVCDDDVVGQRRLRETAAGWQLDKEQLEP